ncbi:tetratricopeptide repeat domain protein [Aspergillus karnatakaensis]|uniref:tetratricopeptide repeat domain protein n=1 Tax=Aspergillus karnatakaensis TaxID=1810916 RepID=UPI003CCCA830
MSSSPTDQIPEIWSQAVARYEQANAKQLDLASLRGMKTVDDLLASIDSENNAFDGFRAKRGRLFSALKTAMHPIQLVSDVAATAVQTSPAPIIFGAVKYLLDAASGVSAKYDAIIELMEILKDFAIRLDIYARQHISEHLRDKLTDITVAMLEVFAVSRRQIERGRLREFGKNLLLGNDEGMLNKLHGLLDGESHLVGAETLTEVKVANSKIQRVDSSLSRLTQQIANLRATQPPTEQAQDKGARQHVKRVLQPTTGADEIYSAVDRSRIAGTGDWIREEQDFRDWVKRDHPLLWVTGTPGAGKTHLASNVIQYLRDRFPQNVQHPSHVAVAYFFFKDDDLRTRSLHQALCDISFKIAQNDLVYSKHIVSSVDSRDEIATISSLWQKLYVEFFIDNDTLDTTVYLVLDALDEAFPEDRLELCELLCDLQQGGRLQFLILGRPHISAEVEELVESLAAPTIYVSALNNSDDIVRYIQARISKSASLRRASPQLRSEIVHTLAINAQGMFIWVDLMLRQLLRTRDEGSMRKALKEAPRGLDEMIRHTLHGLSESLKDLPQYADDLNEMIAWVSCSMSPLTLEEMEAVLIWRSATGDGWIWLEGYLRRQYASFFQLIREDGLTTAELQSTEIYEAVSTQDDEMDFSEPGNQPDYNSDPKTTHVVLAHASLGDFFRSKIKSMVSAKDCPAIGINHHEAQVMLFKRYYEIISCPQDSTKFDISSILLERASTAVIPTLEAIDITQCKSNDKQVIGMDLVHMLTDDYIMPRFAMETGYIPRAEEAVVLLMKWLTDPEVQHGLPAKEKAWVDSVISGHPFDIFLPCIRYISREWLLEANTNVDPVCEFIHNYLYARGTSPRENVDSAHVVIDTAEWCDLPKNAAWYRRVAMALRNLGYLDECLEYFERSIAMAIQEDRGGEDEWLGRAEMATAYYTRGEYNHAIVIQRSSIQQLDSGPTPRLKNGRGECWKLHQLLELQGLCHTHLGDEEEGLSFHRRALEHNPHCNTCIRATVRYLNKRQRYAEIVSLLEEMGTANQLSECLITNYDLDDSFTQWIRTAAHHTSQTPFLINAYSVAVITARKERKAVQAASLELCLGVLHYAYAERAHAARIWERLISTYRGSKAEGDITFILESASHCLSTHYITSVLEHDVHTPESQRYGQILERLAQGKALNLMENPDKPSIKATSFVTNSEVGLMLGKYYKLAGRHTDANSCFKAQVTECIRLLSDNDPSNDASAFRRLAGVFSATGDVQAAVDMLLQSYSLTACSSVICKGCQEPVKLDGIHICRYCHNVQLCGKCFGQLTGGGWTWVYACSPKHEWLTIPAMPQALRERGDHHKDLVWMKGGWISLDDYKIYLMENWADSDLKSRAP